MSCLAHNVVARRLRVAARAGETHRATQIVHSGPPPETGHGLCSTDGNSNFAQPLVRPTAARIGDEPMFEFQTHCPVCFTAVADWSARCPKCRYHPDSYNRAQDDVAMVARYRSFPPEAAEGADAAGNSWRRFLPVWLGGTTRASA